MSHTPTQTPDSSSGTDSVVPSLQNFDIEKLPVAIRYVGEAIDTSGDKPWQHDFWSVQIGEGRNTWTTQYRTGLGLRIKAKQSWAKDTPKKPKIADVMHCLFLDAQAADSSFSDWCADFGYDNDSITALTIYRQCEETARNLRRVFDAATRAKIQKAVEDM